MDILANFMFKVKESKEEFTLNLVTKVSTFVKFGIIARVPSIIFTVKPLITFSFAKSN